MDQELIAKMAKDENILNGKDRLIQAADMRDDQSMSIFYACLM